LIFCL